VGEHYRLSVGATAGLKAHEVTRPKEW
jgi:hypothetical protein